MSSKQSIEEYIRMGIVDIMHKTGLSASKLGEKSGHKSSYVGNILSESSGSMPSFHGLADLCSCAGMSLSDFFAGYEPSDPSLASQLKRLLTPEEEKRLVALLHKANRRTVELLFEVVEHLTKGGWS